MSISETVERTDGTSQMDHSASLHVDEDKTNKSVETLDAECATLESGLLHTDEAAESENCRELSEELKDFQHDEFDKMHNLGRKISWIGNADDQYLLQFLKHEEETDLYSPHEQDSTGPVEDTDSIQSPNTKLKKEEGLDNVNNANTGLCIRKNNRSDSLDLTLKKSSESLRTNVLKNFVTSYSATKPLTGFGKQQKTRKTASRKFSEYENSTKVKHLYSRRVSIGGSKATYDRVTEKKENSNSSAKCQNLGNPTITVDKKEEATDSNAAAREEEDLIIPLRFFSTKKNFHYGEEKLVMDPSVQPLGQNGRTFLRSSLSGQKSPPISVFLHSKASAVQPITTALFPQRLPLPSFAAQFFSPLPQRTRSHTMIPNVKSDAFMVPFTMGSVPYQGALMTPFSSENRWNFANPLVAYPYGIPAHE